MLSNDRASSDSQVFQTTCFDVERSLKLVSGDRSFLRELVCVFFNEYPRLLIDIDAAIQTSDAATLKRMAHTLKGAMNNFGAAPACALARQLEERGRDNLLADAATIAAELRPAVEKLAAELERFAGPID